MTDTKESFIGVPMTLKDSLHSLRGVDLARAVGVHPVTVSAWKRGASLPPTTRLPSLAQALGIPRADLSVLVARERKARLRRMRRLAAAGGGKGAVASCRQPAPLAALRRGQKSASVPAVAGMAGLSVGDGDAIQ